MVDKMTPGTGANVQQFRMQQQGMPASAKPAEKPSFFGGEKKPVIGKAVAKETLSELAAHVSNLSRRLRILEEKYSNLRKRMRVSDQNTIKLDKDLNKKSKVIESELSDYRRDFVDLKDKTKLIVKELKDCAKTSDVKLIQNYINLWEPMNFVTRSEFDRVLNEKIKDVIEEMKNY